MPGPGLKTEMIRPGQCLWRGDIFKCPGLDNERHESWHPAPAAFLNLIKTRGLSRHGEVEVTVVDYDSRSDLLHLVWEKLVLPDEFLNSVEHCVVLLLLADQLRLPPHQLLPQPLLLAELHLQAGPGLLHSAQQIWELRHKPGGKMLDWETGELTECRLQGKHRQTTRHQH